MITLNTYKTCVDSYDMILGNSNIYESENLLPFAYYKRNSELELVLNENGELQNINFTEGKSIKVPCFGITTRKIKPLPLCNDLKYIAKDLSSYLNKEQSAKLKQEINIKDDDLFSYLYPNIRSDKIKTNCFTLFLDLISDLNNKYPSKKLQAIINYVTNNNVINDLIEYNILSYTNNNLKIITKNREKSDNKKKKKDSSNNSRKTFCKMESTNSR